MLLNSKGHIENLKILKQTLKLKVMKTKMNEMNKKSINSKLISCIALSLVLSTAVLLPCQKAVGIVPNTSPTANSGLIKSTETRENSGLRLSGEEMHGAKSATADDCKTLMAQFKAEIIFSSCHVVHAYETQNHLKTNGIHDSFLGKFR